MVICERQFWCLIERLPSPLPEVSNIPHPLQSSWTLSSVLSASYRSVFWVHSIPRIGWLDFRSDFESDLSQNFQCRSSRGGQAYLGLGWWWQWDVSEDEISSEDVAEISSHAWDQLFLFDSESILCWWNISALYFSFSKICVAESYIFHIFVGSAIREERKVSIYSFVTFSWKCYLLTNQSIHWVMCMLKYPVGQK